MANQFSQSARKATSMSEVMEGRKQIKTEELIRFYPDGVTVNEFDMITTKEGSFPVFAFVEDEKVYAFGGYMMNKIVNGWIEMYEGDIEQASHDLKMAGGCKIRFENSRTKDGKNIVLPYILD